MTERELEALQRGVSRHGRAWARILDDTELGPCFVRPDGTMRTAVDLKDKWTAITRDQEVPTTSLLQGLALRKESPL